jgi:hypothetical protein
MSSLGLISHRLFLAAVQEKNGFPPAAGREEGSLPPADIQVREVPVELIELGRPMRIEGCFPFGAVGLPRRNL